MEELATLDDSQLADLADSLALLRLRRRRRDADRYEDRRPLDRDANRDEDLRPRDANRYEDRRPPRRPEVEEPLRSDDDEARSEDSFRRSRHREPRKVDDVFDTEVGRSVDSELPRRQLGRSVDCEASRRRGQLERSSHSHLERSVDSLKFELKFETDDDRGRRSREAPPRRSSEAPPRRALSAPRRSAQPARPQSRSQSRKPLQPKPNAPNTAHVLGWPSSVMHSGPNRAWVPAVKVGTPRQLNNR